MRGLTRCILTVSVTLLGVGPVAAQPGGGSFQPGFGTFGTPATSETYLLLKSGAGDPYILLKNKAVQKELNFTQDQLQELIPTVDRATWSVVHEKQVQRLEQILWQQKGVLAFKEAKVQEQLQLSKAQKDSIAGMFNDFERDSDKTLKDNKGLAATKKIAELKKELAGRVNGALTPGQTEAFDALLGVKLAATPGAAAVAKAVHAEIRFTEGQMQQLDAAVDKVIQKFLNAKQVQRLGEIALQQKGVLAFKETKLQEQLKLSNAQANSIALLIAAFDRDSEKILKEDKSLTAYKKVTEMKKELTQQVQAVLTAQQRQTYDALLGQKFSMFGVKS